VVVRDEARLQAALLDDDPLEIRAVHDRAARTAPKKGRGCSGADHLGHGPPDEREEGRSG
jgi:hypothetical protein